MSLSSSVGIGARDKRLCSQCGKNTLRKGEKHSLCFDCLDHGPVSMEDLRCDLCRSWTPAAFVAATAEYSDGSQARKDALRLAGSGANLPDRPEPAMEVEAPLVTQVTSGVNPPLGLTQEMVNAAVQSFFAQSLGSLQGPVLPGLSALLGQGVPAGSLGATSSQEKPPVSKKAKTSKGKSSSLAKTKAPKEPSSALSDPVVGSEEADLPPPPAPVSSKKRKRASSKPREVDRSSLFDGDQGLSAGLLSAGGQAAGLAQRGYLDESFESSASRFEGAGDPRLESGALDRSFDRESALSGRTSIGCDRGSIVGTVLGSFPRAVQVLYSLA